jgi:hypothetical protein
MPIWFTCLEGSSVGKEMQAVIFRIPVHETSTTYKLKLEGKCAKGVPAKDRLFDMDLVSLYSPTFGEISEWTIGLYQELQYSE